MEAIRRRRGGRKKEEKEMEENESKLEVEHCGLREQSNISSAGSALRGARNPISLRLPHGKLPRPSQDRPFKEHKPTYERLQQPRSLEIDHIVGIREVSSFGSSLAKTEIWRRNNENEQEHELE